MSQIGKLVSAWRYPVKGMRGEAMDEMFVSFSGVYGDRVYGFRSPGAMPGFPYHTAREQEELLLYKPRFKNAAAAAQPPNLGEAQAIAPGITPIFADRSCFTVDVETPDGRVVSIEDPQLLDVLAESRDDGAKVTLAYSERPMTDCRPLSMFSVSTARQLGEETGQDIDIRRFRANLCVDFDAGGFAENDLVGKTIKIGDTVTLAIIERDPRCKMIALDPETADHEPKILQHLTQAHEGYAGVYAAVLVEGIVRPGDPITLA
jgi:uncharacterized protein YcbX